MVRAVHVNDVAGVGSAAVQQARADGLDWQLWPLPGGRDRSLPVKVALRVADVFRFHPTGRRADVLHIHYGLFGYYAWSVRRPYLLHLHGTDVRSTIGHRTLGPWIAQSVSRADRVVYSTPDLSAAVTAMRPDALWVPAPLQPELCGPQVLDSGRWTGTMSMSDGQSRSAVRSGGPKVVFSSRWEEVKGLDRLIDTAHRIGRRHPDADMIGIDWGPGADRAREAGVRLQPFLPGREFRALLAGADVVVGQQSDHPLVVVADLEAMALQRPLVARFTAKQYYGDVAPLWNTAEIDPVDAVSAILADPAAAAEKARAERAWALRHHSPEAFVQTISGIYTEITQRG